MPLFGHHTLSPPPTPREGGGQGQAVGEAEELSPAVDCFVARAYCPSLQRSRTLLLTPMELRALAETVRVRWGEKRVPDKMDWRVMG